MIEFLAERWLSDVKKQWPSVVSSFAPIQHGAKISKGVFDLIRYPARQLVQRGSVLAGVRQGVQSFRRTTAPASLDLLSQLIQFVLYHIDSRGGGDPPAAIEHRGTPGAASARPTDASGRLSSTAATSQV